MSARQPTRAELVAVLHEKSCEATAWQQLFVEPKPHVKLEVLIPGPRFDRWEYWFLHAPMRADGGVLRIDDGEYPRAFLLGAIPSRVREAINACPYRRAALVKIEAASAAYQRGLR